MTTTLQVNFIVRPAGITYERAMAVAMSVGARSVGVDMTPEEAAERWPVKRQVLVDRLSNKPESPVQTPKREAPATGPKPKPVVAATQKRERKPEGPRWRKKPDVEPETPLYEQRAQQREAPKPKPNAEPTGGKFALGLEQHRDELTRLHGLGHNDGEIGKQLGVSRKQVGRWRNTLGLPVQAYTRNYNRELHMALLEGYRAGRTDRQTADLLGMDRQAVGQARIRYGIPCIRAER